MKGQSLTDLGQYIRMTVQGLVEFGPCGPRIQRSGHRGIASQQGSSVGIIMRPRPFLRQKCQRFKRAGDCPLCKGIDADIDRRVPAWNCHGSLSFVGIEGKTYLLREAEFNTQFFGDVE